MGSELFILFPFTGGERVLCLTCTSSLSEDESEVLEDDEDDVELVELVDGSVTSRFKTLLSESLSLLLPVNGTWSVSNTHKLKHQLALTDKIFLNELAKRLMCLHKYPLTKNIWYSNQQQQQDIKPNLS